MPEKCKKKQRTRDLSPKEKLFCYYMAYLNNPGEAAAKAGYSASPAARAVSLLDDRRIRRLIQTWRGRARQEAGTLAALGLERLIFSSNNDIFKLLDSNGEITGGDFAGLDTFMVSEVRKQKGGGIEIKLFDKVKAAEVMAGIAKTMTGASGEKTEETGKSFLEAFQRSAAVVSASGADAQVDEESASGEV